LNESDTGEEGLPDGLTIMHIAIDIYHSDIPTLQRIVRALMDAGFDPLARPSSDVHIPLIHCVYREYSKVIVMLIDKFGFDYLGASLPAHAGVGFFHHIFRCRNSRALLSHLFQSLPHLKECVNDRWGDLYKTPIMVLVQNGIGATSGTILFDYYNSIGVDFSAIDRKGKSVLMYACGGSYYSLQNATPIGIASYFREWKDCFQCYPRILHQRDNSGRTALFYCQHASFAAFLIREGIDAMHSDRQGRLATYDCLPDVREEIVSIPGYNFTHRDRRGHTLFSWLFQKLKRGYQRRHHGVRQETSWEELFAYFQLDELDADFQHGPYQYTMLHMAAQSSLDDEAQRTIQYLLNVKRCNPFLKDTVGYTWIELLASNSMYTVSPTLVRSVVYSSIRSQVAIHCGLPVRFAS